jgi:hypothetical protein
MNMTTLPKVLCGKIDKVEQSYGKRLASGTAVKAWITDGVPQKFSGLNVTFYPELKEGSDVRLDPVTGELV